MPLNLHLSGNCTYFNYPSENCIPPHNPNPEKKIYGFKSKVKQAIYDTSINGLIQTKLNNSHFFFLTLTYRECKKQEAMNSHISEYLEYLDKKESPYKRGGFVWVKELTKRETPHFHLLIDLQFKFMYNKKSRRKKAYKDKNGKFNWKKAKYHEYGRLSYHWERIRKDFSNNGVDVTEIYKPTGILYYLAKYISKEKLKDSKTKIWARSHDWIINKYTVDDEDAIEYFEKKAKIISKNAKETENAFYKATYTLHWKVSVYESIKFYYPDLDIERLKL